MKIAVFQMDLVAGNPQANRDKVEKWVQLIIMEQPDVLVLPELWTTAYTLPTLRQILGEDETDTEVFLQELAKKHHVHFVAGSIAVEEDGHIYNRALVINSAGETIYQYDKMHLVPMLDEHLYFTGGKERAAIFELDGHKMGLIICYDIRFPELMRSLALQGAETVFVLAEWPSARASHWETLQKARAIENQVYIVSSNRVGTYDQVEFAGKSMVIDPWGEVLAEGSAENEETITANLRIEEVSRIRKEVPVFTSRRPELYE